MPKLALALALTLALAGCQHQPDAAPHTETLLQNPLFAERYAEELVQSLVELQIQQNPIVEDEDKKAYLDEQRRAWMKVTKEAQKKQREGTSGHWVPVLAYTKGEVLYLDNQLHFDSLFVSTPSADTHVYITTAVDPRDVEFPDPTALYLGAVQSPYGAQTYDVPPQDDPLLYRTVVLWHPKLEQVYAFAQLSAR